MSTQKIQSIIESSIAVKQQYVSDPAFLQKINDAVTLVANAFKNGFKVQFCGNGGSAADAQHLAAEFSGRFYKNRKALPSDALHCNSSYVTAVANDYSYDEIYSRLVEGTMYKGD
ncbi:MAG: D-sedoheptulose-7-phosphate isomerase, partial [Sediminibacterium sp.]